MSSRRLRAFKRWMSSHSICYGDGIRFTDDPGHGIFVTTLYDLNEGEVIATIPKSACLTIPNSGAREIVAESGLEGTLGLAVAIMYEKSLGEASPWAGYLHVLPQYECLPLLWSIPEIDGLLQGTELHKTVKEDKAHIYDDWKECILPLLDSQSLKLKREFFGIEQYFAARSLIASRSFEIEKHHGFGMVPLADLFNHKTGAEDVHFTALSSDYTSESDDEDSNGSVVENGQPFPDVVEIGVPMKNSDGERELLPIAVEEDSPVLEMILVKDVKAGDEVFNTYGTLGNAALLHRYGFTEEGNPFDIINIDLELVLQWASSAFSNRHGRARLSLWRRLNYSGCVSQDSEYFEISYNGEPQFELIVLLYMISLSNEAYDMLDLAMATGQNCMLRRVSKENGKWKGELLEEMATDKDQLLTRGVCNALLALADIRESLYSSNSIDDDIEALNRCCPVRERKVYHSLMLRVSERRILNRLRSYASAGVKLMKKKMKNQRPKK